MKPVFKPSDFENCCTPGQMADMVNAAIDRFEAEAPMSMVGMSIRTEPSVPENTILVREPSTGLGIGFTFGVAKAHFEGKLTCNRCGSGELEDLKRAADELNDTPAHPMSLHYRKLVTNLLNAAWAFFPVEVVRYGDQMDGGQ